ncbi:MAG: D-alanyl-D-alanine carboxypeptidase family protein [Myxococcales bacterium]|nr:D-alanyl-D-alanine carboxypeptidase family protein [Myxococcales bacterium]
MSYEEKRVRVKEIGRLKADSPLLVVIPSAIAGKEMKLHVLAAAALSTMNHAAHADLGFALAAASGFRPHRWKSRADYEQTMVKKYGSVAEGKKWMAYESPHETGLAIDFGVGGLEPKRATVIAQRKTPLHQWLVTNAWRFGWHPYKNEPWHWEYPIPQIAWQSGNPNDLSKPEPVGPLSFDPDLDDYIEDVFE